jgi:hypothetical protein
MLMYNGQPAGLETALWNYPTIVVASRMNNAGRVIRWYGAKDIGNTWSGELRCLQIETNFAFTQSDWPDSGPSRWRRFEMAI